MPDPEKSIPEFKRGDIGDKLRGTVNADLTGFETGSVRFLAKRMSNMSADAIPLACEVVSTGQTSDVEHTTDGTLPVGEYYAEVEAVRDGVRMTFPNRSPRPGAKPYARFNVVQDLG